MSETYLRCDECGATANLIGSVALGEIHECPKRGAWRLVTPAPAAGAGEAPESAGVAPLLSRVTGRPLTQADVDALYGMLDAEVLIATRLRAQLDAAREEAERLARVAADGSVSRAAYESACTERDEARQQLAAAREEAGREKARLDWLEAWTAGDVTICPPGHHGADATHWLVSFTDDTRGDSYGTWDIEYHGPSLRAAIDAARRAAEGEG